jgi:hypothetical protein
MEKLIGFDPGSQREAPGEIIILPEARPNVKLDKRIILPRTIQQMIMVELHIQAISPFLQFIIEIKLGGIGEVVLPDKL